MHRETGTILQRETQFSRTSPRFTISFHVSKLPIWHFVKLSHFATNVMQIIGKSSIYPRDLPPCAACRSGDRAYFTSFFTRKVISWRQKRARRSGKPVFCRGQTRGQFDMKKESDFWPNKGRADGDRKKEDFFYSSANAESDDRKDFLVSLL